MFKIFLLFVALNDKVKTKTKNTHKLFVKILNDSCSWDCRNDILVSEIIPFENESARVCCDSSHRTERHRKFSDLIFGDVEHAEPCETTDAVGQLC